MHQRCAGHTEHIAVGPLYDPVTLGDSGLRCFMEDSHLAAGVRDLCRAIRIQDANGPSANETIEGANRVLRVLRRHWVRHLHAGRDVLDGHDMPASIAPNSPVLIGLDHVVGREDVTPFLNLASERPTAVRDLPELSPHATHAVRVGSLVAE